MEKYTIKWSLHWGRKWVELWSNIHKEIPTGSWTIKQDNNNPDPIEVTEVKIDDSKEELNVPAQDITEDIFVKKIVTRASSQNWSELVGLNLCNKQSFWHQIDFPFEGFLNYITIHYITIHYIILYYITLHYFILHYNTLHYISLHYITLKYIIPNTKHQYITLKYISTLH